jgi:hypothetical protein
MVYQNLCEAHLKEVALIQIQETMTLQISSHSLIHYNLMCKRAHMKTMAFG